MDVEAAVPDEVDACVVWGELEGGVYLDACSVGDGVRGEEGRGGEERGEGAGDEGGGLELDGGVEEVGEDEEDAGVGVGECGEGAGSGHLGGVRVDAPCHPAGGGDEAAGEGSVEGGVVGVVRP